MKKVSTRMLGVFLAVILMFSVVGCGETPPAAESFNVTVTGGSGGGKFDKDADCTVTATVGEGKEFSKWTVAGETVSTANPYTFKVTKDVDITAVLKNIYTITVIGGKIGGQTEITAFEGQSLIAVADVIDGKKFLGWYEGETLLTAESEYSFTASKTVSIEAKYADMFTVSVLGGKIEGQTSATVESGVSVTAIADASASGKVFIGWYEGETLLSSDASYTFAVTKSISIEAKFANSYTVNVAGGKIDGQTSVIAAEGKSLTAIADVFEHGKRFLGWYDGETLLSSEATYTFTVEKSIDIAAKYIDTFTVTVNGGKINGAATAVVDAGEEVSIIFDAAENRTFEKWMIGETMHSTDADCTLTVNADVEITAIYTQTLLTPKNDTNQMFTKKPSGYSDMIVEIDRQKDDGANKMTAFTEGADHVLFYIYTSTTANKEDFVGTFKLVQTVKGAEAEMQTDGFKSIPVGKTPGDYFFDRVGNADFFGFIQASVGDDYDKFQTYYLAAQTVATTGSIYKDSGISEIGTSVLQQAVPVTVTVIGGEGSGTYEKGADCTVTATVEEGNYFVNWTQNGNVVSDKVTYTFKVSEDVTLTAVTAPIPAEKFTVTVENGTGGGEFSAGEECTVTATVPDAKGFARWTAGGVEVSKSFNYTFRVTENITLTAEFEDLVQIITPKNDTNQMFNYVGFGDNRNTTEFDRQKDENNQSMSAFAQGVDYILYHVYTSQSADKDTDSVATFMLVKDKEGAGKIVTLNGTPSISCGTTPGNYYIDNVSKVDFFGFFSAVIGDSFSETQNYYFAAQAIAIENSYFVSSAISEIGSSTIRHTV